MSLEIRFTATCLSPFATDHRFSEKGDRHRGGNDFAYSRLYCATEPVPFFHEPQLKETLGASRSWGCSISNSLASWKPIGEATSTLGKVSRWLL